VMKPKPLSRISLFTFPFKLLYLLRLLPNNLCPNYIKKLTIKDNPHFCGGAVWLQKRSL
jgi:hypothetical protein